MKKIREHPLNLNFKNLNFTSSNDSLKGLVLLA